MRDALRTKLQAHRATWRGRANAYLEPRHEDVAHWTLDAVLSMLRHTGEGHRLWMEARDADFWEGV